MARPTIAPPKRTRWCCRGRWRRWDGYEGGDQDGRAGGEDAEFGGEGVAEAAGKVGEDGEDKGAAAARCDCGGRGTPGGGVVVGCG